MQHVKRFDCCKHFALALNSRENRLPTTSKTMGLIYAPALTTYGWSEQPFRAHKPARRTSRRASWNEHGELNMKTLNRRKPLHSRLADAFCSALPGAWATSALLAIAANVGSTNHNLAAFAVVGAFVAAAATVACGLVAMIDDDMI